MKKYLLFMLGVLLALPGIARDFTYEYEGQTLIYTVLDEEAKTCETKKGEESWANGHFYGYRAGNKVTGNLVIPSVAKDGDIEYTVTSISSGAFGNCSELASVYIPNSVTTINSGAFYKCSGLTSVTIPNSVITIGDMAFADCSSLTSVDIPNSVTLIDSRAFLECSGLTSVTIGNSVITIGDVAFGGCSSLTSVDIPNSVTSIGNSAFSSCSSLTSVDIPNSVTSIGNNTFSDCTALTEIIVPPSVETIGASAFARNTNLTSIIMGHRVKSIGEKAFDGCPAQNVYITAQTPPDVLDNTFSNYTGDLYVQGEAAAKLYSEAEYCWPQFESHLLIEPTHLDVIGDKIIDGKAGDTFQFTAKLYPEEVTLPQIFWRSTNPKIATVDKNGLVTLHVDLSEVMVTAEDAAEQVGTCKIIAESLYANVPAVEVEVSNGGKPTGINQLINGNKATGDIDFSAPIGVYNLQGAMVGHSLDNVSPGIYIVRQGNIVKKFAVN